MENSEDYYPDLDDLEFLSVPELFGNGTKNRSALVPCIYAPFCDGIFSTPNISAHVHICPQLPLFTFLGGSKAQCDSLNEEEVFCGCEKVRSELDEVYFLRRGFILQDCDAEVTGESVEPVAAVVNEVADEQCHFSGNLIDRGRAIFRIEAVVNNSEGRPERGGTQEEVITSGEELVGIVRERRRNATKVL